MANECVCLCVCAHAYLYTQPLSVSIEANSASWHFEGHLIFTLIVWDCSISMTPFMQLADWIAVCLCMTPLYQSGLVSLSVIHYWSSLSILFQTSCLLKLLVLVYSVFFPNDLDNSFVIFDIWCQTFFLTLLIPQIHQMFLKVLVGNISLEQRVCVHETFMAINAILGTYYLWGKVYRT